MMYSEIAFTEKSDGKSIFRRNIIARTDEIMKYLNSARSKGQDLYRSMYSYDEDIIAHMKTARSVKGFRGRYYLERLILDVDKGSDTDEEVHKKAIMLYEQITGDWQVKPESFSVWYSGTGYHFSLPDIFHFSPSNYLPNEVCATLQKWFPMIDPNPYCNTGLIRMGNTINHKSGRYKIRLEEDDLYDTTEMILELASKGEVRKLPPLEKSLVDYSARIEKDKRTIEVEKSLDEPTMIITCVQKLYQRGAIVGQRHQEMIALASSFRKSGVPKEGIITMLHDWAGTMELYEVKKIVNDVFKNGYLPSCNNRILSKHCDPKCIYYKNKNLTLDVKSSSDLEKDFVSFIRQDLRTKTFDLNDIFPIGHSHIMIPEDNVLFFGDTGLNKTALVQNIAVRCPHLKTLYLNLEFSGNLLYRRNIQIANRMSKEEVEEYYRLNSGGLSSTVDHIKVLCTSPDLISIQRLIADTEPNLVVIDTIGKLGVGGIKDLTAQSDTLGKALKDIATQSKAILINIHHVSKSSVTDMKGNTKRLNAHSGKGSSSLEDMADEVWTIEGDRDDCKRTFMSQKTRDKKPFSAILKLNPENFTFSQLFGG